MITLSHKYFIKLITGIKLKNHHLKLLTYKNLSAFDGSRPTFYMSKWVGTVGAENGAIRLNCEINNEIVPFLDWPTLN